MTNIIFTTEADNKLLEIIKKYNLDKYKALVKIDFISKNFVNGEIQEENMLNYLQKELEISQQIAGQISKEIIINIIPLLVKASEEDLKNPKTREEISKRVFGENKKIETTAVKSIEEENVTSQNFMGDKKDKESNKFETPLNKKITNPLKREKKIEEISKLPKKLSTPEKLKLGKSDKYRESIG